MFLLAGYNYYGTERMYSGETGTEMEADIFVGVVYYQRLRHMVSDKFQVHYYYCINIFGQFIDNTAVVVEDCVVLLVISVPVTSDYIVL